MQEESVNLVQEDQQTEENSSLIAKSVPSVSVQETTTDIEVEVTTTTPSTAVSLAETIAVTTATAAVAASTTTTTTETESISSTIIIEDSNIDENLNNNSNINNDNTNNNNNNNNNTNNNSNNNNCDKDNESDGDDDENDDESKGENFDGYNGSGRTVTLQMLLAANVLQPGKSAMTIEYLGQKFVGDLLSDGKIKSQETETVFLSPSAWAMHCKRIINPDKKSGCGWASVKYKGKKLDAYKATWLRKCALQKESTPDEGDDYIVELEKKSDTPPPPIKRTVLPHNAINNRNITHDANTLIESIPFQSINKMQPFLVTITSSALLLADFHCHLTPYEVCGYLGGTWDVNSHTLSITKTFPCKNTRHDRHKSADIEKEIQKAIIKDQLILVGWYHSHPKFQSQPTLRDCDSQLDYQIKMRGPSDITYTPCVGFIFSPYYEEHSSYESSVTSFWVVPPPENRQNIEYGRPMLMQYAIVMEPELPIEVQNEMKSCVEYYESFRNELFDFNHTFKDDTSYLEKLKHSLYHKFPKKQSHKEFWNSICRLLKCKEVDEFIPPAVQHHQHHQTHFQQQNISHTGFNTAIEQQPISTIDITKSEPMDHQTSAEIKIENRDVVKIDDDDDVIIKTGKTSPELKVLSLQEQLCLPSGLNMNPRLINSSTAITAPSSNVLSTTTPPTPIANTTTTTASSSPRDSPITIPSNSASPAKFEIPIRASPSPAKSDSSSNRTRNSPAPSPGKFSISDISRNSPSVTPNKYEPTVMPPTSTHTPTANDLMAASLASLAGQLPSNFLTGDLNAFFQQQQQQQQKDFGNSSLNQLAATAAKAGNKPPSSTISSTMDHFEKSNEHLFPTNFNMPGTSKTNIDSSVLTKTSTPKQQDTSSLRSTRSSAGASYKTKLMKELEDLKNDPIKISELMRSPEYAALLLQQAEALGATTLGSLGFGTDFSFLGGNSTKKATTDYTNLLQASKLLGYDAYMQQAKTSDLSSFFQQQMAPVPTGSSSSSKKQQHQQQSLSQQSDYATLLQTYSKLFDSSSAYSGVSKVGVNSAISQELSSILSSAGNMSGSGGGGSSSKKKDTSNDVLNQILQSDKNNELNALLYHQNKAAVDLNALFVSPSSSSSKVNNDNTSNYYAQLAQEKMQDYAALFQHHGKYGIPDPLSKSTLAANNMFMSPSALLKLQQDSLNAMMMKPPKSSASSSSSSSSRARESSASPAQERLTPTKSSRESPATMSGVKYNFSAVDLAISSVSANTPSPSPSEGSRRPSDTPPVDLSRIYQDPPPTKKRMEFSSIADLAAPPAKMNKPNDRDDVLNLSSND